MTDRARLPFRRIAPALLALAAALAVSGCERDAQTAVAQTDDVCGRECLIGLLDRYLEAVQSHDPEMAPLAEDFRGTQNAVATMPGEGVWASVTDLGQMQRRYADAETGQALYVGLIGQGDTTYLVSLRIRAEAGRISEAEWLMSGPEQAPLFNPVGFVANPPPDASIAPATSGETRDAAIAAAQSYFDGIEAGDAGAVAAFEDCFRIENGFWWVGRLPDREPVDPTLAQPGFDAPFRPEPASCVGGFADLPSSISVIADRRFLFDDQAGILWAGVVHQRPLTAVNGAGDPLPWSAVSNLFDIEDGRIRGIYSLRKDLPADVTGSGWAAQD